MHFKDSTIFSIKHLNKYSFKGPFEETQFQKEIWDRHFQLEILIGNISKGNKEKHYEMNLWKKDFKLSILIIFALFVHSDLSVFSVFFLSSQSSILSQSSLFFLSSQSPLFSQYFQFWWHRLHSLHRLHRIHRFYRLLRFHSFHRMHRFFLQI